jgi:hypothetical protein
MSQLTTQKKYPPVVGKRASSSLSSIASIAASSQTILFYAAGATVFAGGATMVYRTFSYFPRIEKAAQEAKLAAEAAQKAAEGAQSTSAESVRILERVEPQVASTDNNVAQ